MFVTGEVPPLHHVPGVNAVPASQAQEYAARRARELFPADRKSQVFLVEDSSGTSDEFIEQSGQLISEGTPFLETPLFQVLIPCLNSDCEIHIWWAGDESEDAATHCDRQAFQAALLDLLTAGEWINLVYRPPSPGTGDLESVAKPAKDSSRR